MPREPVVRRPRPGEPSWLRMATERISRGGIVALATETFYGLAVDPRDAAAVGRLLRLKGHPAGRPVLLLAAGRDQVAAAVGLPDAPGATRLAERFWPGPLTLVLPLRAPLPACPGRTAAIRVPAAITPRTLAGAVGHPVTGTSANPAGEPPASTAPAVAAYFRGKVDLILDDGPSPGEAPSTILDLTGRVPVLLRPGPVSREALEDCLGGAVSDPPGGRR